jgi:NADH-ubiquinone oxidoreductase chain 6
MLYILKGMVFSGYSVVFLFFMQVLSIIFGILVIISKNPIVSVLFLIGLFLGISVYLIMLGINFIGLSYLLVYIGAVSILFLFILMLINVRISELSVDTSNSIPLATIVGIAFVFCINVILPNIFNLDFILPIANFILSYVTSALWDGNLIETSHITTIGNIIYASHSGWILMTSIILLIAMVGSIVITSKSRNNLNIRGFDFITLPLQSSIVPYIWVPHSKAKQINFIFSCSDRTFDINGI